MGNGRDHDRNQRKRPIDAISSGGSRDQTGEGNAFLNYGDEGISLLSSTTLSAGFVQDECSLHDSLDGHHNPKKFKTTIVKGTFSSPSASSASDASGGIDTGFNPFSKPSSMPHMSHTSSSPILSSQGSSISIGSCPSLSPLFSAGFDAAMELANAARRFFERSTTKEVFVNLKSSLRPILLKRLKELSEMEATYEVGLEMDDSVYLLKLLGSSNRELNFVGKKTGEGALKLQEGVEGEGRKLFHSPMSSMPNSDDK